MSALKDNAVDQEVLHAWMSPTRAAGPAKEDLHVERLGFDHVLAESFPKTVGCLRSSNQATGRQVYPQNLVVIGVEFCEVFVAVSRVYLGRGQQHCWDSRIVKSSLCGTEFTNNQSKRGGGAGG